MDFYHIVINAYDFVNFEHFPLVLMSETYSNISNKRYP